VAFTDHRRPVGPAAIGWERSQWFKSCHLEKICRIPFPDGEYGGKISEEERDRSDSNSTGEHSFPGTFDHTERLPAPPGVLQGVLDSENSLLNMLIERLGNVGADAVRTETSSSFQHFGIIPFPESRSFPFANPLLVPSDVQDLSSDCDYSSYIPLKSTKDAKAHHLVNGSARNV
jgi:hypothetical protein